MPIHGPMSPSLVSVSLLVCLLVPLSTPAKAQAKQTPPVTPDPETPSLRQHPSIERIQVAGAHTLRTILDQAAKRFRRLHPNVSFVLTGSGSTNGMEAVSSDTAQIGMVSRAVTDMELAAKPELILTQIATDGIVFVTHLSNPVTDLSWQQAADILSGRIRHWSLVQGPAAPIVLCAPDHQQGTLDSVTGSFDLSVERLKSGRDLTALLQLRDARDLDRGSVRILDGNQALLAAVMTQQNTLGMVSLGVAETIRSRGAAIRILTIDGVQPTPENIQKGTYRLQRPLSLVTSRYAGAKVAEFVRFVQGPEGQQILRGLWLVPFDPKNHRPAEPVRPAVEAEPVPAPMPGGGR